jgi:hypothetical protein
MLDQIGSLGKQVAFLVVFVAVVCALLLVVQQTAKNQANNNVSEETKEILAIVAVGAADSKRGISAQRIIDIKGNEIELQEGVVARDNFLRKARNHAVIVERERGGYGVTAWNGRAQSGDYFSYNIIKNKPIQSCLASAEQGCTKIEGSLYGSFLFDPCPPIESICATASKTSLN